MEYRSAMMDSPRFELVIVGVIMNAELAVEPCQKDSSASI